MKNQILFLSLVTTALLAGCMKNDGDAPDTGAPATHITAMAQGKGDSSLDTKAPVTGTSLNGQTAEVYASTYDISSYTGSLLTTFSNVYARGTMTFDDNNYVDFDTADFGGLNGGNSQLPQDGAAVYLYSFYPKGWDRAVSTPGGVGTECESMSYTFDGKTDVMSTWITPADNMTIKYNDVANMPDKADFTFKHLLTRYHIQMKANDADAISAWGHVKSIQIKEADPAKPVNQVLYDKSVTSVPMILGYVAHATNTTPTAFFKLTGTPAAPTYSNNKFATADYASAFALTQSYQNACYSMVAPVTVDATSAAELMLVVNTVLADGKQIAVEVPVTLDQSKFTANANSTRGFSITLTLNFRVGMIQATAVAEQWKDYGIQYEDVDVPVPPLAIGDVRYGGVVYWIDAANATKYKVVSVAEAPSGLAWAAKASYAIAGAQSDTDGKANAAAIKAYFDANTGGTVTESTFDAAFPAAAWCYNYKGKDGADPVGTWYLPAKSELQYLWCAFNGKAPISWVGPGTDAGAPVDAAAQSVFNKYLTDAGGTNITNDYIWSATEHSGDNPYAWILDFSNGQTTFNDKGGDVIYVRCVKSITPPPPAIGDVKDGGVVYYVNGSNYKVVSVVEAPSGLAWAAKASYAIAGARSTTDGKANTAAIKAYFDAYKGSIITETTFDAAFPAAAWCYNYKGKDNTDPVGTWYLPAKNELQYLWCAFNGAAPITNAGVPADAAAQSVFNKYLTDAGGTNITTSGNFWLSADSENSSSRAWYINFSNGNTSDLYSKNDSNYVRCVKNL